MPEKRYLHSLGAARTAAMLARRHGCNVEKARAAGLLHDLARSWTSEALMLYAERHGLEISPAERTAPVLLHARVAADVAFRELGIDDAEVLQAIERHTIPVDGMTALDSVVYIADACEPSRSFPDRSELLHAALRSLEEGLFRCVSSAIAYLQSRNLEPAPQTLALLDRLSRTYGATR